MSLFAKPLEDDYEEWGGCPDESYEGCDFEPLTTDEELELLWGGYESQRDLIAEKKTFKEKRNLAIKNQAHKLGDHKFDSGHEVSKRDDMIAAFDLIWAMFKNDVAAKLAGYYAGDGMLTGHAFINDSIKAYGETRNIFGSFNGTIINIELIYDHIGNYQYGMPAIDETDDGQRALFIASILFHEYLHTFQGDQNRNLDYKEGAAWAATKWFVFSGGGHEFLEKHIAKTMDDVYPKGETHFMAFLDLLHRPPSLTSNSMLKRLFYAFF